VLVSEDSSVGSSAELQATSCALGGNSRQNKQTNDAKRDAEKEAGKRMTDAQEERFHDEVTHHGLGYWEMREIAVQILRGAI
jgi:hypothetical protein